MALENLIYDFRQKSSLELSFRKDTQLFIENLLGLLFPHFSQKRYSSLEEITVEKLKLRIDLIKILRHIVDEKEITAIADIFFNRLEEIYLSLLQDADAIERGDPAAENVDEVIITYPGFLAISIYRVANVFYELNVPIFPRLLTEYAHQLTGIDIHPGAKIGKRFCIDHGTGIVIGETTVIGDNVKLYQGVTLGALSVEKTTNKSKRHPTIEDNVIIYSGATILGGDTVIGNNSIIGGNVWLIESVPPFSVVYHKSNVKVRNQKDDDNIINYVI
ncbi:MAG TPA: serine acetyltransferase [Ignavibacteriales bacterium]|nr:serine acetyltransferase [Ignavibacteriales bacterium]